MDFPSVSRNGAAVRLFEVGVGVVVGSLHPLDEFQASGDPAVEIAKRLPGRAIDQSLRGQPEDPLCGLVDLDDDALPIERDHPVRQRLQDALVVVFQGEHVGKQTCIFERHRDVRGKSFEPANVDRGELAAALVEHLDDAEALAGTVDDRHIEHIARAKP